MRRNHTMKTYWWQDKIDDYQQWHTPQWCRYFARNLQERTSPQPGMGRRCFPLSVPASGPPVISLSFYSGRKKRCDPLIR
ncbi:hypothetical protein FNH25_07985 [Morganella morganii]|nr:hypothetical protein [Morganella morganii]